MNDMAKNLVLWIIIALVLMMVFRHFGAPTVAGDIPYSQFIKDVKTGHVESLEGSVVRKECVPNVCGHDLVDAETLAQCRDQLSAQLSSCACHQNAFHRPPWVRRRHSGYIGLAISPLG